MPLTPSSEYLSSYLEKWQSSPQLKNSRLQEKSLGLLFKEFCPANSAIEHILLKVSALNDFYSTNIFDTYTVALHIRDMNIDVRLKNGDLSLVNELAVVSIQNKKRNFYSFATKYCNHHFPESFPIYDSYVEKMLLHYARTDHFYSFHKEDLKHYESFVKIIKEFQAHYRLGNFTLRQIDIFLWLAGKDSFPTNYKAGITRRPSGTVQKSTIP